MHQMGLKSETKNVWTALSAEKNVYAVDGFHSTFLSFISRNFMSSVNDSPPPYHRGYPTSSQHVSRLWHLLAEILILCMYDRWIVINLQITIINYTTNRWLISRCWKKGSRKRKENHVKIFKRC